MMKVQEFRQLLLAVADAFDLRDVLTDAMVVVDNKLKEPVAVWRSPSFRVWINRRSPPNSKQQAMFYAVWVVWRAVNRNRSRATDRKRIERIGTRAGLVYLHGHAGRVNPRDRDACRVFSDWLEENGHERDSRRLRAVN